MNVIKNTGQKLGEITHHTQNAATKLAHDLEIDKKAVELKEKAVASYETNTGRSAKVDGNVLKYSAVATAGAMAITSLPAVVIASAVGATVVAAVAGNASEIKETYSQKTGRDGNKDVQGVKEVTKKVAQAGKEFSDSFKEGYSSVEHHEIK
ncbi:hypothetical protein HDV06_005160 [Boothiomyces sp. JEL0866]|nr:hypothetical protein HDV06_005160 [Boothiomyces sp. JEL0866]